MAKSKRMKNRNKKSTWKRNNITLAIGLLIAVILLGIGIFMNIGATDKRDSGLLDCENADYSQYIKYTTNDNMLGIELKQKMKVYEDAANSALQNNDWASYNELMALYYDTLNAYNSGNTKSTLEHKDDAINAKNNCKESIENTFKRQESTAMWFMICSGIVAGVTIITYAILVTITMKARKH